MSFWRKGPDAADPNIEAAEKVMQGMEDGLRAALPQLDAVLAEPSPSVAH